MEFEIDALIAARSVDVDMAEAIMRVELGSSVTKMSSKELKRDLLVFAKKNPMLFLDLMKDENIHIRNIGIKSVESGIINLSHDQRTFTWASNSRKLMTQCIILHVINNCEWSEDTDVYFILNFRYYDISESYTS